MKRSVPSRNFETGLDMEEQSFTWKIKNFHLIRKNILMVNLQRIDFTAGETIGNRHKSTWKVFLREKSEEGKRWIGIFFCIADPTKNSNLANSFAEMTFAMLNEKGEATSRSDTGQRHIPTDVAFGTCCGPTKFIDAEDLRTCTEENLVIYLNFKLYVPTESKTNSLQAITEEFKAKLAAQAQARENLANLLKNPITLTDIKIVSNDEKEFSMPRGILAARSDVFATMLCTDMTEANSGVIHLPDISSKAFQVLLDFLYPGELHPEWCHAEVIVELANAAGKYQLKDLLKFLDLTLGKVCRLENVMALVTLARQLSLKVAEEELILFVRKEAVDSTNNFIRIVNPEIPGIEATATYNSKRRRSQR